MRMARTSIKKKEFKMKRGITKQDKDEQPTFAGSPGRAPGPESSRGVLSADRFRQN